MHGLWSSYIYGIIQGEFFQLKELEKIGPKKGIGKEDYFLFCSPWTLSNFGLHCSIAVAQSVKDVVQSLVDDGLVTMDKIANSNYFWSFPSTAAKAVSCLNEWNGGGNWYAYESLL